jgi:deoxyribonuclease-4
MSAPKYYLGSVEEAISYGANTLMFYTGAPQNAFRAPLEKLKIEEGRALLKEHGFDENKIVVHAPYIINIANQLNQGNYDMAKSVLLNEVKRTAGFGCKLLVLHPGSHVNTGVENGVDSIVKALDWVLSQDGTDVKIALETMAGKGSEMGTSFEQMQEIISKCKYPERLGICLDTCHINDNNYKVSEFDKILDNVENTIGLDKLLVIHVNDSKNPIGSHKDRHENLGYGEIGFEALNAVVHNPRVSEVPKILETPYVEDKPPYKIEIDMLKNSKFEDWR